MEIFYTEIDKFKNKHSKDELVLYSDREFKTEKRFYEYTIGRYLVKNIAKKQYGVENLEISNDKNGKPFFKNNEIFFNISHSNNIVVVCFDKNPCGVDIEYIKERDLLKLSKYFKIEFKNLDSFYKFWTLKESSYKLGKKAEGVYSEIFNKNYYLTAVSNKNFEEKIKIIRF